MRCVLRYLNKVLRDAYQQLINILTLLSATDLRCGGNAEDAFAQLQTQGHFGERAQSPAHGHQTQ